MTVYFGVARAGLVLSGALLLSACVGGPDPDSFGERLRLSGGELTDIGEQWNEGEAMTARGRELIDEARQEMAEADDLASDGRGKLSTGEDMVARGELMKRQAEEAHRARQISLGNGYPGAAGFGAGQM